MGNRNTETKNEAKNKWNTKQAISWFLDGILAKTKTFFFFLKSKNTRATSRLKRGQHYRPYRYWGHSEGSFLVRIWTVTADWKFGLKRQGRCTCEITYRCSHHCDSIGVANNSETCNAAMPPLGVQPEERESVSQTSAPPCSCGFTHKTWKWSVMGGWMKKMGCIVYVSFSLF